MMISIALRFIPTLIEETQRIMNAQASRGVDLENGSIKEKNYGHFIIDCSTICFCI